MTFSMLSLLLHDDDVPATARAALRAAAGTTAGRRRAHLEDAALALFRDAHLDCEEARALVGLE